MKYHEHKNPVNEQVKTKAQDVNSALDFVEKQFHPRPGCLLLTGGRGLPRDQEPSQPGTNECRTRPDHIMMLSRSQCWSILLSAKDTFKLSEDVEM